MLRWIQTRFARFTATNRCTMADIQSICMWMIIKKITSSRLARMGSSACWRSRTFWWWAVKMGSFWKSNSCELLSLITYFYESRIINQNTNNPYSVQLRFPVPKSPKNAKYPRGSPFLHFRVQTTPRWKLQNQGLAHFIEQGPNQSQRKPTPTHRPRWKQVLPLDDWQFPGYFRTH